MTNMPSRFVWKLVFLCGAMAGSSWAAADSYMVCSVASSDLVLKGGVERPTNPAYSDVCLAVLPPSCRNWTVDKKPCAYRSCLVSNGVNACPSGEPASVQTHLIDTYVAKELKPFTPAEREAMNQALDAEAKRIVNQWTDNGRKPLTPVMSRAARNVSCVAVAAVSDGRLVCVPRE